MNEGLGYFFYVAVKQSARETGTETERQTEPEPEGEGEDQRGTSRAISVVGGFASHPATCACGCVPSTPSLFEMARLRKEYQASKKNEIEAEAEAKTEAETEHQAS